jgi:glycosyltransferase involved in cell wall biosynthesis
MRILFALPGLHRVRRGAEIVFESIAQEIALEGEHSVTLIGSGEEIPGRAYRFKRIPSVSRNHFEGWPKMPFFRSEFMYEDLTFAAGLTASSWRAETDVTVTCNYPYTNWALRSHSPWRNRPAHVFVTQNGDWPAYERRREYRFFWCDGLLCTNPHYWQRNRDRWFSTLIPNGIDQKRFFPGAADRALLGLPENRPVVLMVSALEEGKRVLQGIRAVAEVPGAFLVIAGDGPLRGQVDRLAADLLLGRFLRTTFSHELMPVLYRSSNVFLHMAIQEPFGNVYIEALASGTPIVAHDDENTRWILEDHAYLIDTNLQALVVEALTKAMHTPASNTAQGVAFAASRYSWSIIAREYCEFFADVLRYVQRFDARHHAKNYL